MEVFQSNSSSETMNQGQGRPSEALVPYGRTVAGFPEPESPVPTIEEMCQEAGALEGAYNEGVQSDSDADFPPEDPGMWVRREGSVGDRSQGPSTGSDAWAPQGASPAAGGQRDHARCAWLRVSGSEEVMNQFRRELS